MAKRLDEIVRSDLGSRIEAPPVNPLLLLHRLLLGRYLLAAILGTVLGCGGLIAGYLATRPVYSSTGLIAVRPVLDKLLYDTEATEVPPMFESYLESQARMVQRRKVIIEAVKDEELTRSGWPTGVQGVQQLQESITVNRPRGSFLIAVTVTAAAPEMAERAVNAVLRAYRDESQKNESQDLASRISELEQLSATLRRQSDEKRSAITNLALNTYQTIDLAFIERNLLDRWAATRSEIASITRELASAGLDETVPDSSIPGGTLDGRRETPRDVEELGTMELAALDPTGGLMRVLGELDIIDREISAKQGTLGENHTQMRQLRSRRESASQQLAAKIEEVRAFVRERGLLDREAIGFGMSSVQLQNVRAALQAELDEIQSELARLAQARSQTERLSAELANIQRQLSEGERQLEQLRTERENLTLGRVSIASEGEMPFGPSTDRRIPLALFGGAAGFGFGIGICVLWGLLDRRLMHIEHFDDRREFPHVLGLLPDLAVGGDQTRITAQHAVNLIREMIESDLETIAWKRDGAPVLAISSASSGDGKTSLASSLGVCFAASGRRTLLIDSDFGGGGLTALFDLRGAEGLLNLKEGEPLNGHVRGTRHRNLSVLPIGREVPSDDSPVSRRSLSQLLDRVAGTYDLVIVDTGPLLGAVEANAVAALADGIVLVVGRGQRSDLVQMCVERLDRIGSRCLGVVFNRAHHADFERSSARLLSASRRSGPTTKSVHTEPFPLVPPDNADIGGIDESGGKR